MSEETHGRRWQIGRFNALNNGLIQVEDIDENNQRLVIELKVGGTVVKRQITTTSIE